MSELIIRDKLIELGFIVKRIGSKMPNRCATVHHPHKRNGWFIIHDESVSYGDWSNNIERGWFWIEEFHKHTEWEQIQLMTDEEKRRYNEELLHKHRKIEEQRQAQKIIEEKDRQLRILEINGVYHICKTVTELHPYLRVKKVKNQIDFRLDQQNRLVIPMYNMDGILCGYQYIDADGTKKFKAGSIHKESFYPLKPISCDIGQLDTIFLCEGYATAASIYQALNETYCYNYGVLACFSAGNIDAVADAILGKYGRKCVIAIQDQDDAGTKIKTKGFTVGISKGEDANDVANQFGLEMVSNIILEKMKYL